MKRLKETTIKAYTTNQLLKHLDRLDDQHIKTAGSSAYRIDFQSGQVLKSNGDHCFFYCSDYDRDVIISAIRGLYQRLYA